ncbi:MAG: endonuclease/exonuclease/phosphatase family protein [Deltaproteobacteria bacterium]|nr:endonuclease/exonuclease/phosphatase family protein [Deltaproteobacteria bacterium]
MKASPLASSSHTLSILTFNVWFGLEERGILWMRPLEPSGRREKRYQILLSELTGLRPDFIAVQEANPIPGYGRRLARDLGYDEIHKVYNGGIKIGGLGIPVNLKMGLVILAKREFRLRRAGARQISGDPFGIYGDLFCFHFTDSRHVMAGVALVRGSPLYLVHTHTYPGPPEGREILDLMERWRDEKRISKRDYEKRLRTLRRVFRRREMEIERILDFVKTVSGTAPTVLLGDFNMTEESSPMVRLLEEGRFWDTYRVANPEKAGITWDGENNENTRFWEISGRSRRGTRAVYDRLRAEYDRKSRRIDYILLNSAFDSEQILESRVVLDRPVDGVHTSDHYGVLTTVALKP